MTVRYERRNHVLATLSSLFNNRDSFPDVVFLVENEEESERIYAHKAILSSSEHFRGMFSHSFSESQGEVRVRDISVSSFKSMIAFLYTGKISLSPENVMEILHKSTEYSLQEVRRCCDEYISSNIAPENVCGLYEQGLTYNLPKVVSECYKFICANAYEVFLNDKSTQMSLESMVTIVQSDTLGLSEVQLVHCLVAWGKKKFGESYREDLQPVIPHLRISTVSPEELYTEIAPTGIFPLEVLYEAHVYHSTKGKFGTKFTTKRTRTPRVPPVISFTWDSLPGDEVSDQGTTLHCAARRHRLVRTKFPVPTNWVGYIEISRSDLIGCSDVFIGITSENSSDLPTYLRNCPTNALTYATNGAFDIWHKTNVVCSTGLSPKAGVGMLIDCRENFVKFYNLEKKKYVYAAHFDEGLVPVYPCVSVGGCCSGGTFKFTKVTCDPREFPPV